MVSWVLLASKSKDIHNHYTLASEAPHPWFQKFLQSWDCSCHLEQRLESDVRGDTQVLEKSVCIIVINVSNANNDYRL